MSIGGVITSTNCRDITELGGLGSRMRGTTAFVVGGAGLVGFRPGDSWPWPSRLSC